MKQAFSSVLIFTGSILLAYTGYLLFQRFSPSYISFVKAPTSYYVSPQNILPVEMTIPSIHVDLPIIPAAIHNNSWEVTSRGVSYLRTSPVPGETGNSILYGHNWDSLLGPLTSVHPGDIISVSYANNSEKAFSVTYVTVVSPDDVSILAPSSDKRITLYTCTGLFDTKRLVVTAVIAKNPTIGQGF